MPSELNKLKHRYVTKKIVKKCGNVLKMSDLRPGLIKTTLFRGCKSARENEDNFS